MAKVIIEGIPGLDGTYDFDPSSFTNREWHTVKQLSGVRVGEFDEALAAGDNDLLVALTSIALTRAGKRFPVDALWDAETGKIRFEVDEAVEEDPPSASPNEDGSSDADDEKKQRSGETSSSTGDDLQVTHLRPTGTQD